MTAIPLRRERVLPPALALLLCLGLPGAVAAQEPDTVPLPDTTEAADSVEVTRRAAAADSTSNLTGTVASSRTGEPIHGARVSIPEIEYGAITDESGNFRIRELPPGTYDVRVHYLGYSTNQRPIRLRPGRVTNVTFVLERDVLKVADLKVTVKAPDTPHPMAEFRRRMQKGFGEYITRNDIERRSPRNTSDLFRGVTGVDVARRQFGTSQILMRRGARRCKPALFLDGVLRRDFPVDNLDPDAIQAIEIYRRNAEIPPKFQGASNCGILVVHTRVQATRPGELGGGGGP